MLDGNTAALNEYLERQLKLKISDQDLLNAQRWEEAIQEQLDTWMGDESKEGMVRLYDAFSECDLAEQFLSSICIQDTPVDANNLTAKQLIALAQAAINLREAIEMKLRAWI